uniref:NADP-dependent oxidoreductase domain-containing protein n=1 Tax=Chromera velia CCMP2878 TaxID=1169474 RepID=A0A0G4HUX6_9ALVE|eukprot:Cvel_1381.t1-p1 / transcript=Cvel_1381.t1 / gene=Cvel_1381 / organism=Chromera_velia_CCMP2878 / gene_product=Aldose reductase, putative / transcript_product=Aldose reductase, putative / location=Cvel_scaffold48:1057-2602(-) / protein_length=326 / sequence_SO=supercontig / SO=protein_coding / is_pseudo=false
MSTTPAVKSVIPLNDGNSIPAFGYGTWQAAPGVVGTALKEAVKAGFRHIDCAKVYQNEEEVGRALKELFDEGVVKREDLFITSKLWNTSHDPELVISECKKTIEDLQVGYLDLYLIHWPASWVYPEGGKFESADHYFPRNEKGGAQWKEVPLTATWAKMEELVDMKLVKSIGISNFSVEETEMIVAASKKHKPVTNQVELHPALNQAALKKACEKHGIVLTAYCPLGIGMNEQDTGLHNVETVKAIAKKAGLTAAQLLLQWNLQEGNVVLTKSVTPSRIQENAALTTVKLDPEVVKQLNEYEAANPRRIVNPDFFREEKVPFFASA